MQVNSAAAHIACTITVSNTVVHNTPLHARYSRPPQDATLCCWTLLQEVHLSGWLRGRRPRGRGRRGRGVALCAGRLPAGQRRTPDAPLQPGDAPLQQVQDLSFVEATSTSLSREDWDRAYQAGIPCGAKHARSPTCWPPCCACARGWVSGTGWQTQTSSAQICMQSWLSTACPAWTS